MGKRRLAFNIVAFMLACCILPISFYVSNTWGSPTAVGFTIWLFSAVGFAAIWEELDLKMVKLYN
tara:strand:- start:336 stop:530 length:195 start_codon:yes stop_codon:yes gene_type:complete